MQEELRGLLRSEHSTILHLFRALDENSDGMIKRDELRRAIEGLNLSAASNCSGADGEFFDAVDENSDGSIEYPELYRALRRTSTSDAGTADRSQRVARAAERPQASESAHAVKHSQPAPVPPPTPPPSRPPVQATPRAQPSDGRRLIASSDAPSTPHAATQRGAATLSASAAATPHASGAGGPSALPGKGTRDRQVVPPAAAAAAEDESCGEFRSRAYMLLHAHNHPVRVLAIPTRELSRSLNPWQA